MSDELIYYIRTLSKVYQYMIIIYVLMSWLPAIRESVVGDFLGKLVEPFLSPFRRLIPPIGGVLDISPFIALIGLWLAESGLEALVRLFFR